MSTANERERSDIEDLLPWHAAGTLDPRDTRRVEAALANAKPLEARGFSYSYDMLGEAALTA